MSWFGYLGTVVGVVMLLATLWSGRSDAPVRDRVIPGLRRQLAALRRRHRGRRVLALHADLTTRARGGGHWTIEVVFDDPDRGRQLVGDGAPLEEALAERLAAWTDRTAASLGARAEIVTGSDC